MLGLRRANLKTLHFSQFIGNAPLTGIGAKFLFSTYAICRNLSDSTKKPAFQLDKKVSAYLEG